MNPYAIPGLIASGLVFALTVLVFRARSDSHQNRSFAAFSFVLSLWMLNAVGLRFLTDDPNHAFAFWATGIAAAILQFPIIVWFYSTFPGPGPRALRKPIVAVLLVGVFVLFLAMFLIRTDWFAEGTYWVPTLRVYGAQARMGLVALQIIGAVASLAGVAILTSARKYPTTALERRKTRILSLVMGVYLAYLAAWSLALAPFADRSSSPPILLLNFFGLQVGALWLCVGIAYGILSSQLFDIDLKIKSSLKRGSLAGMFLLAFFVVGVMAENFLTARYGWVVGGLVAGLLLFAIAPLQRFAERLANAAMPDVRNTDDYRTYRKHEVYRAALEGMLKDRVVSPKERGVLKRLQEQLGISYRVAQAMEDELNGPRRRTATG